MTQFHANLENAGESRLMHRLDAQIKLCEFMGGGDIGDWINKHGSDFSQLLEEDPELEGSIMSSSPDPVLLTVIKDRLIEMRKDGFEIEADEETRLRAS